MIYMAKVYADLVEKGYYTTNPDEASGTLKVVPANLRDQVDKELEERSKPATA